MYRLMEVRVVFLGVIEKMVCCENPQYLVVMLAFRPFLWRLVRKNGLRLQVSHAIAGIWKILPQGRNLHQPRLRGKLHYFSKTHRISYTLIHSQSIIHQQHQLLLTHEILFGIQ